MTDSNGIEELRQRMQERRRVTLTEGRMLLERLDSASAEIARLQAQLAQQPPPAAPVAPVAPVAPLPEPLQALLDQATTQASTAAEVPAAVAALCRDWLRLRARLQQLLTLEQETCAELDRLEAQADALIQRLAGEAHPEP